VSELIASAAGLATELASLEARREPARVELAERRDAARRAEAERDEASRALEQEESVYAAAYREIEGLESDVEAARSEVFSAMNAATALRHAVEHASAARERALETLARLDAEAADLGVEAHRAERARADAEQALERGRAALEESAMARAARDSELSAARSERDRLSQDLRARENEIAGRQARLHSLEELDAAHAEYGEAARLVLTDPDRRIAHTGSVADHLEVEPGFERAVEACLGDLLQHVVVGSEDAARAGLALVREQNAGRCGFVIPAGRADGSGAPHVDSRGVRSLWSIVRIAGDQAQTIRAAIGDAWIADSLDLALESSRDLAGRVATPAGDVARGGVVLEGGVRSEVRGILGTKAEIRELRTSLDSDRALAARVGEQIAEIEVRIASAEAAIAALIDEQHRQEKSLVGIDAQRQRATDEAERVQRKAEQVATERRRTEEERDALEARQAEARESIRRLETEQQGADGRLAAAQRRLLDAREALERQSRQVAEAKAAHAALVERASGIGSDVGRLEQAGRELEERIAARADERRRAGERRAELERSIEDAERQLDEGLRTFDALKEDVRSAEDRTNGLRAEHNSVDARIRDARRALEAVHDEAGRHEIALATADGDLTHLAESCAEMLQEGLEQVAAEVAALEAAGELAAVRLAEDLPSDEERDEGEEDDRSRDRAIEPSGDRDVEYATSGQAETTPADALPLTVEQAIAQLKAKLERLGPVNILAIGQFDELEHRHTFLTTQRKDLVDSIAATNEAIRRIEKTTKERFREAFDAINRNFEETFTTLFGGGRAGLVLLDETDQLESGLDIIAQPPGKRLQSVQLLSGGEKALTAMALMFAIFKYRPSPFCLLDEIDAPLDDANIGRFVEMLKGMQDHTQFILITHNRKTMEIANRLYGVTMEEPGVSKLISLQLN
jgi:chromosome segregation protein